MDPQILSAIISGVFSLLTGLVSIWLSNRMERLARSQNSLTKPKKRRSISRVFLIFVVGLILGAGAMASRQYDQGHTHYGNMISQCLLIVFALFLAFSHRKRNRGFWPYQLEIVSLWFAYGTGFSLVMGRVWMDLFAVVVAYWIGSAILGGIITTWKKKTPMKREELFQNKIQQPSAPANPPPQKNFREANEASTQAVKSPEVESPLDIVKIRYAKGEITKEEFDQMKKDLA